MLKQIYNYIFYLKLKNNGIFGFIEVHRVCIIDRLAIFYNHFLHFFRNMGYKSVAKLLLFNKILKKNCSFLKKAINLTIMNI